MADYCSSLISSGRNLRSSTLLKRKSEEVIGVSLQKKRNRGRNVRSNRNEVKSRIKILPLPVESVVVNDRGAEKVSENCLPLKTNSSCVVSYAPIVCPNHVQQLPEDSFQVLPPANYVLTKNYAVNCDFALEVMCCGNFTFMGQSVNESVSVDRSSVYVNWNEKELLLVDVLKPQSSSDFVGNGPVVEKLRDWLKEWERRESSDIPHVKRLSKCDPDYELTSESDESSLDCAFLFGPSGIGKTSLVYALAQEMGFTVLEINPSSLRSGKVLTTQLREATLSHHVEGTSIIDRFVVDCEKTDERIMQKNFKCKEKRVEKPKTISNFFKKSQILPADGTTSEKKKGEIKRTRSSLLNYFLPLDSKGKEEFLNESESKDENDHGVIKSEIVMNGLQTKNSVDDVKSLTFSSNTIILIDDVDVVFEEDEGFWSAVNAFIRTTKKPVILTASRNLREVLSNTNSDIEFLKLHPPAATTVAAAIKKMCDNVGIKVELDVVKKLVDFCNDDIRRILLQLQFLQSSLDETICLKLIKGPSISDACLAVENLHYNTYENFPAILSLPLGEKVDLQEMIPKKSSFNVSWLSEDGDEEDPKAEDDKTEPSIDPRLKAGLCHIAEYLDMFSVLDMFFDCTSDREKRHRWNEGLPSIARNEYLSVDNFAIDQLVCWMNVLSSRTTRSKLAPLVSDNLQDPRMSWVWLDKCRFGDLRETYGAISREMVRSQYLNHSAIVEDYCTWLRVMHRAETLRRGNNTKRGGRFLHYFDSIGLNVDTAAIGTLLQQAFVTCNNP